jgi:hypothetical protein
MSTERLKELIQQGWDALINSEHTIEIVEKDIEGRNCLLILLNEGIDQFEICPLSKNWECLEGHASWIESSRYWHLWTSQDPLEKNVMAIILMLGDRLLRAEFGLD